MIIKVYINNRPFEIDCDTGTQDIAWLSISACYLYGKDAWPITTYLPIIARNKKDEILHPKLVICKNIELIGDEIKVKICHGMHCCSAWKSCGSQRDSCSLHW